MKSLEWLNDCLSLCRCSLCASLLWKTSIVRLFTQKNSFDQFIHRHHVDFSFFPLRDTFSLWKMRKSNDAEMRACGEEARPRSNGIWFLFHV
jgi:hypothetical protein